MCGQVKFIVCQIKIKFVPLHICYYHICFLYQQQNKWKSQIGQLQVILMPKGGIVNKVNYRKQNILAWNILVNKADMNQLNNSLSGDDRTVTIGDNDFRWRINTRSRTLEKCFLFIDNSVEVLSMERKCSPKHEKMSGKKQNLKWILIFKEYLTPSVTKIIL